MNYFYHIDPLTSLHEAETKDSRNIKILDLRSTLYDSNIEKLKPGCHLIKLQHRQLEKPDCLNNLFTNLSKLYGNNKDYRFTIVPLHTESYLPFKYEDESSNYITEKKLYDYISEYRNFRIISDNPLSKFFEFHPRVWAETYLLYPTLNIAYFYLNDIISNFNAQYRISYRVNKYNDFRYTALKQLSTISDDKFYYSYNDFYKSNRIPKCKNKINTPSYVVPTELQELNIFGDQVNDLWKYPTDTKNINLLSFLGRRYNFYQSVEGSIKHLLPEVENLYQYLVSDVEIVYDTHTYDPDYNVRKFDEKTLRPMLLGKSFIHIHPWSHLLMKVYGFKTFDILYDKNLLEFYNSFGNDISLNVDLSKEYKTVLKYIKPTVEKICSYTENEWKELNESLKSIKEYNFNRVIDILKINFFEEAFPIQEYK
jgi:hypothetical protein